MSELISREAAIEALRYAQHRFTVADEAGGMGTVKWSENVIYFDAAVNALSLLPSAQTDNQTNQCDSCDYSYQDCPIKNNDVIFGNDIGNDNICACNKYKPPTRPDPCEYCNEDTDGYVKPIEKNNHAFVRFGVSGWELSMRANGWHGSAKIRFCPMCGRNLSIHSKGKWIWKGSINEGFWTCSECGQRFYQGYGNENFCPNCGAKMVEPQESEGL